eukprot:TRINITY_DN8863_c0_g1_i1.p1 TRINITY_DN8863_c0_g1~~TRINITY_DN8863_c0_g1_i1.p1  ORF type:complete len:742 (+),score=162.58 TRINITY_DN8863_c0_g1_i1:170-2227(+)
MRHLEECEAERKIALHKELNRQIRLLNLDNQHKGTFASLEKWNAEKSAYLGTKEVSDSVGAAQYQLGRIDDYDRESKDVHSSTVVAFLAVADELIAEKYERSDEVSGRVASVKGFFEALNAASASKRLVLDDDLAREKFRQGLALQNQEHQEKFDALQDWSAVKEAYLTKKEDINSVAEAQLQLALLDAFENEKAGMTDAAVAPLKSLGAEILGAQYKTEYSSASCENPDEIKSREQTVDDTWARFTDLSAKKKLVLEDDLARETFKAKLRVWNTVHEEAYNKLTQWIGEKTTYLNTREEIDTITKALVQISILQAYEKDKAAATSTNVSSLKKTGQDILTAEYKTEYSHYVWDKPEEIKQRETTVDDGWAKLSELSATKSSWLADELAREEKKEELRLQFAQYAGEFTRFCNNKSAAAASAHFGFTLEEVEASDATITAEDEQTNATATSRTEQFTSTFNEAAGLGVTENVYASQGLDDLAALRTSLGAALDARRAAYAAELQRQRENDALCKKFAGVADPFSQLLVGKRRRSPRARKASRSSSPSSTPALAASTQMERPSQRSRSSRPRSMPRVSPTTGTRSSRPPTWRCSGSSGTSSSPARRRCWRRRSSTLASAVSPRRSTRRSRTTSSSSTRAPRATSSNASSRLASTRSASSCLPPRFSPFSRSTAPTTRLHTRASASS